MLSAEDVVHLSTLTFHSSVSEGGSWRGLGKDGQTDIVRATGYVDPATRLRVLETSDQGPIAGDQVRADRQHVAIGENLAGYPRGRGRLAAGRLTIMLGHRT